MRIAGIIAEYNPLHKGHIHHIEQARKLSHADAVVVIMSGNYVQRGEPAIIDKYARTQMALSAGADAVLELPLSWATGSGERFADGAVSILHRLNCIDTLVYGCETPLSPLWKPLTELLVNETSDYRELLRQHLSSGLSFPSARQRALEMLIPGASELVGSPNNILALEYRKALYRRGNTRIQPIPIQRIGADYNDSRLYDAGLHASATAIRAYLNSSNERNQKDLLSELTSQMSSECLQYLTYQVQTDDFSSALNYALLYLSPDSYTTYQDMNDDLANRLQKLLRDPSIRSFTELSEQLKSRNITRTHINRALLHLLLRVKDSTPEPSAVRLLGFRKQSGIMRCLQDSTDIPIITRMADAPPNVFESDVRAAHLYNQIVYRKTGIVAADEYRHGIIIT